ncbi:DUF2026 family protein [uncultured Methylibium sp.]|uniref:DUF2026 family protein n=1 Tax=uncultured Methylibium sp. TaxID=381093 RepID=UPI0025D2799F|nr:DUF2026 family protein [uncultured Methylibium sp.]
MAQRPLLPLPDYQRIYQVAYSVLEASEIAITHRACIFFASVGAMILRDHYALPATISAGCLAIMVDEQKANVVVYGRDESGVFVNDKDAFHAWVECGDWLIDFMAPIMGMSLRADGRDWHVPRLMLQKRLSERKASLGEIRHAGEFFVNHDRSLANSLLDSQSVQFGDLLNACMAWFRKPPKPLKDIALADSHGPTKKLVARAPSIDGVW